MNDLEDNDGAIFFDANSIMTNRDNDEAGLNLFNSNGSLLSLSVSYGHLGAYDLVEEPIGRAVGISFNPQVDMVLADGMIKKIPLNTNGFFPSRQYENDPIDDGVEADFSISLGNDSDSSLWGKEFHHGMETDQMEEVPNVRPEQGGGLPSAGGGNLAVQEGMTVQGVNETTRKIGGNDDYEQEQEQQPQVSSSSQQVGSHGSHVTSNAARAAK